MPTHKCEICGESGWYCKCPEDDERETMEERLEVLFNEYSQSGFLDSVSDMKEEFTKEITQVFREEIRLAVKECVGDKRTIGSASNGDFLELDYEHNKVKQEILNRLEQMFPSK